MRGLVSIHYKYVPLVPSIKHLIYLAAWRSPFILLPLPAIWGQCRLRRVSSPTPSLDPDLLFRRMPRSPRKHIKVQPAYYGAWEVRDKGHGLCFMTVLSLAYMCLGCERNATVGSGGRIFAADKTAGFPAFPDKQQNPSK